MWLVCDQFKGIIFLNLFVLKLQPQLDYVVIVKQQPRRIEAIFAATLKLAQMGKGTQSREGRKSAPAENLRMRACSSARPVRDLELDGMSKTVSGVYGFGGLSVAKPYPAEKVRSSFAKATETKGQGYDPS
ncbi:hypothetical protein NPX13_g222 [Xylaria arbuscula]|uniref:Uncharacterized protein n=1 Tax=Xylaria arbuscula TaxID=114810 RepID=A0A9W8TS69_9PEZI|nr:hypothetical protein NPX13_g222 [Xylaria arbuscula]